MLRQKIRSFVLNVQNHGRIKKFSRSLILVGLLWILSFPFISRNVFTSENALSGEFLETQFNLDGTTYTVFKSLQEQLRTAPETSQHHKDFILQRLGSQAEVYIQELQSKKERFNIYAYLRSPRGYGNECDVLALPLNHKASVVIGLTFVETWLRRQPKWQAKDFLVVFYEELDYALGMKEFLENYFHQGTTLSASRSFFSTRVEGRCGYLRQGYAFVFPEYDYNKFSLFIDGVNAQLSDIDFYDVTR